MPQAKMSHLVGQNSHQFVYRPSLHNEPSIDSYNASRGGKGINVFIANNKKVGGFFIKLAATN